MAPRDCHVPVTRLSWWEGFPLHLWSKYPQSEDIRVGTQCGTGAKNSDYGQSVADIEGVITSKDAAKGEPVEGDRKNTPPTGSQPMQTSARTQPLRPTAWSWLGPWRPQQGYCSNQLSNPSPFYMPSLWKYPARPMVGPDLNTWF